jgi:hypothetical protein
VTDLQVFNLNKPREAIIPEYRPYVYHCEAGWSPADSIAVAETIEALSADLVTGTSTSTIITATTTDELTATSTDENPETSVDSNVATEIEPAAPVNYSCRDTSVVRACELLEGDDTACLITQKVKDHTVTRYARGWDEVAVESGELGRGGLLERAAAFFGLAPNRKDIPDNFEGRVYTDQTFTIDPGETRYFKMDITFPAFSEGEWWIEAIGDREYGLLDPFWSSQWRYKMPLEITNPTGVDQTEYQVRLKLDGAMADFWNNIQTDGGDIRFIQEVNEGNVFAVPDTDIELDNTYDPAWLGRVALTIPASAVDTTLSEFPVYVDLADLGSDFWAGVQTDGDDIRVTRADGATEVAFELVAIDTGAQTGELHFLAPILDSGADNIFHIYYNNAAATAYATNDTFGAENVWTNGYEAVYHFNEDPTGGAPQALDSTSNDNHATVNGTADVGDLTTGFLGLGYDFAGTSGDFTVDLPNLGISATSDYTYSAWFNSTSFTNGGSGDGNGTYFMDRTTATNALIGLKAISGNYAHQYRYDNGT